MARFRFTGYDTIEYLRGIFTAEVRRDELFIVFFAYDHVSPRGTARADATVSPDPVMCEFHVFAKFYDKLLVVD